jgi:hypothetical protein
MSKKHRKAWRAKIQGVEATPKPAHEQPWQLRGRARREYIEAQARALYEQEGHDALDLSIRNGQLTLEAFESQMNESRGEGQAWGPDVSVYEARMNRSLQERLLRLRRTMMRDYRQMIERELQEEHEMAEEASEADIQSSEEPARTPDSPNPTAPADSSGPSKPDTRREVVSATEAA